MQQDKIWDYFQNVEHADNIFPEARQKYMLQFVEPGKRILNIGVGNGAFERFAINKGVDVWCLDPSSKTIESLKATLNLGDKAQHGYAQKMPFDADFFDMVLMSEVLEHLDDSTLIQALTEIFRVLKPRGQFVASTPYRENIESGTVVCPSCGDVFHKIGHVQSFDKIRIRDLLESNGFTVHRIWITTFIDWRRGGAFNFLKSLIRWVLSRMGEAVADPHLLVIARK